MSYMNRNHIVELFFKDRDRKILISGTDDIKYKEVRYVQPPTTLYFGTLAHLTDRMTHNGIKSTTKGYLKLYDTKELAQEFAKRFVQRDDDKIVVIEVNALAAFTDGMRFSTYKDHEYIVVRIDKKYIGEVIE
jgi:RNA:NAD 2'-phosphotransferase (TPT1/KptA family)